MATIASSTPSRLSAERRFYSRMAIFLAVIVLIGFAPSFYLRGIVPSYPRPNPSLTTGVLVHGALFTLWMLAFVFQSQLIAAGRRDLHMKTGAASMVLALVLIPVMYLTAVWQVPRANQAPFTDPLNWTAIPLGGILPFAYLVWQGWARRREGQWHKRLMLSAAILVVAGPAVGRIPLAPPSFAAFAAQYLAGVLLLFLPLILWDRRSRGQVHPASWTGLGLALASSVIPLVLVGFGAWAPVARHLPGI